MALTRQALTKQDIFDHVARHLIEQGEKSQEEYCCMYRGPRGLKCAVGSLIRDGDYKPYFEDKVFREDLPQKGSPQWEILAAVENFVGRKLTIEDRVLISDLQRLHDLQPPRYWPRELRQLAEIHGLEVPYFLLEALLDDMAHEHWTRIPGEDT